jgi:hypothetical protein
MIQCGFCSALLTQNPKPLTGPVPFGTSPLPSTKDVQGVPFDAQINLAEALACMKALADKMEDDGPSAWADADTWKEAIQRLRNACSWFLPNNHYVACLPPKADAVTHAETTAGGWDPSPNNNVFFEKSHFNGPAGAWEPSGNGSGATVPTQDDQFKKWQLAVVLTHELSRVGQGPLPPGGPQEPQGPTRPGWEVFIQDAKRYLLDAYTARAAAELSPAEGGPNQVSNGQGGMEMSSEVSGWYKFFSSRTRSSVLRIQILQARGGTCPGFEGQIPTADW